MKPTKNIKSMKFIGMPDNIQDGHVDLIVTLTNNSEYWLEVTTLQAFISHM
jgi:hypothetical protein